MRRLKVQIVPNIKPYLKDVYRTHLGENSRQDFLRLDMNENPDGLPEEFLQNVLSKIDAEYLATYPEYSSLIQKIADYDRIHPENVCLSNGSDGAIKYIFDCYVSPGDTVLLTEPTFAMYPVYCKIFGAHPKFIAYNHNFDFPVDTFIDEISPK